MNFNVREGIGFFCLKLPPPIAMNTTITDLDSVSDVIDIS